MWGRHAFQGVRSFLRAGGESVRGAGRRRGRRGWAVEALEGRALLSVYLVDSPGDAGAGSGGVGDLRYAIEQADHATGDSTIAFAPDLYGQQIDLSQGMLSINKPSGTLTIEGPGANLLAISAGGQGQVFTISPTSHVEIRGLTITDGIGPQGGGIQNNGTLTVGACTIAGNTAMGQGGGGIANGPFGHLTITGSTISGNESVLAGGGGISNEGTLSIGDSTISGNKVIQASGGGIANTAALTLTDDTISDNSATLDGGGIDNQALQGGTITMNNTIVAGDVGTAEPSTDDILDSGDLAATHLTGSNDLVEAGQVGSLVNTLVAVDPRLGPLQYNGGPTRTQALLSGSPAVDAGNPSLVPAGVTTDQRGTGYSRVVLGRLDIGAYEVQLPITLSPQTPESGSGIVTGQIPVIGLTIIPPGPTAPAATTGA